MKSFYLILSYCFFSSVCLTCTVTFCYGQTDSTANRTLRNSLNQSNHFWVGYLNDFESNPAITAFYNRFNLNVNRQHTFMGKYYLGYEYNARANWKFKKHGGFSLRYQFKTYGLYTNPMAGLAFNYRIKLSRNSLLSWGFEGCALKSEYDWGNRTISGTLLPPSEIMIPDFNTGLIFTNRNFIAEGVIQHLMEPNVAFYKTPGAASSLHRIYFTRISYLLPIQPGFSFLPGISSRWTLNHTKVVTGMLTANYNCLAGTIEFGTDHSFGTRLSIMTRQNNARNQFRLSATYRRYTSLSRDFGTEVGEFRFGINYNFGRYSK